MRGKYFTCIATGNTYTIKDDLVSWGFGWRSERRAWIREGIDQQDRRLFEAFVNGIPEKNLAPKWPGAKLGFIEEPENDIDKLVDEFMEGLK